MSTPPLKLDEQWSLELGIAIVLGMLARATLLDYAGYLESGLLSALEGIVLGDEVAGYARALLRAVPVDDEAVALAETVSQVPGHRSRRVDSLLRHGREGSCPSSRSRTSASGSARKCSPSTT
jgi:hypothetical protein